MKIKIRRMQFDDIKDVYHLEQRIFPDAWSLESFKANVKKRQNSYPCVMTIDSKIVGYAVIWHYAGEVHIGNFAIDPDFRRQGLGNHLLKFILQKFNQYEEIYLEVRRSNLPAIELYKKFDFEELYIRSAYYSSDGEDALVMVKRNIQLK